MQSKADYIAFSDHDDIWYPNKIEESLKTLKEKNVDLVYCDANQIGEKGNILHESYLRYKNMPIINEKNNSKKEILAFSRHIAIGCSQIFTKEVKEKLIPFTPSTMAHDWNTVYIASKMKGIYCLVIDYTETMHLEEETSSKTYIYGNKKKETTINHI